MSKPMSAAVMAAAKKNTPKASEATLENIRNKLKDVRVLEAEIKDLSEQLAAKSATRLRIIRDELPSMYEIAEIDKIGLEASGNLPGYDTELKPYYSANLPEEGDPRRAAAFKKFPWLRDLTKNKFTADFSKGQGKQADKLVKFMEKSKIEYSNKVSVHAGTLTAEIRRRFQSGKPLPPADLDLLGGFVGKIVKLTPREDTK